MARFSVPVALARNTAADTHGCPARSSARACTVTRPAGGRPLTLTWTGSTSAAAAGPASSRTGGAPGGPPPHPAAASTSTAPASPQARYRHLPRAWSLASAQAAGQTRERAGPRFTALGHDTAARAGLARPPKNALEAGRHSSQTAARPVSQSSTGTIRKSTVAPTTEPITGYTWPPTAK